MGVFSGDLAETVNCRLKDTFMRYSSRGGGKHPGRQTLTTQVLSQKNPSQVLQREAVRLILEGLALKRGARPKTRNVL